MVRASEASDDRCVKSGTPTVQGAVHSGCQGDGRFRDRETGSVWNISGEAVEGEFAGERLAEVVHGNHFWFAWGVFRPETEVWRK